MMCPECKSENTKFRPLIRHKQYIAKIFHTSKLFECLDCFLFFSWLESVQHKVDEYK